MAAFGTFLASAVIFGAIWYSVTRRIKRKVFYHEYRHGEVREWSE